MSVEETECELQQLVSSDEENNPLNNDSITPPGSNVAKPSVADNPKTVHSLHKLSSEFSYRSNSKVCWINITFNISYIQFR